MSSAAYRHRLASVTTLSLGEHPHKDAMCLMEAVAFVKGEEWSDHPACTCPVLGAFLRAWNDGLPGLDRNRLLLPLLPKIIDTRQSPAIAEQRAILALNWLVHEFVPAWLRLAEFDDHARNLELLPNLFSLDIPDPETALIRQAERATAKAWVTNFSTARTAAIRGAKAAAADAIDASGGIAARAAAWERLFQNTLDALKSTVQTQSRAIANANDTATIKANHWDAALNAARDAARVVAIRNIADTRIDAAVYCLSATEEMLQARALQLLDMMIDLKE